MYKLSITGLTIALICNMASAQRPAATIEMIRRALPLEGAPLAEEGPYSVFSEGAFNSARHILFRPAELDSFPAQNNLPVMVWGNGGCAINGRGFSGFLRTVASHSFLVVTTTAIEGEEPRDQNAEDLFAAITWVEAENDRAGSPLHGKIDTTQIAAMGSSCGGFLSVSLGTDPRVSTIGLFNSGVEEPNPDEPVSKYATTNALAELHGPALFIDGHEVDFMMETSHNNFNLVTHVPAFYGARHNAGHSATFFHPGGGEFANVASSWLKYHFKGDTEAARMFVGVDCEHCTNPNWDTESTGFQ